MGRCQSQGAPADAVIEALVHAADPGLVAAPGRRFFGWIIGAAHEAAVAADWLTSAWGQNAGLYAASPSAAMAEKVSARWLLDMLRLPEECSVGFVTGATMANFTCLAAARNAVLARAGWNVEALGLRGAPRVRLLLSDDAHASVFAALRFHRRNKTMKYASILETVGRTPVVRLANIAPAHVALYAKLESFNPMGSVKDRFARAVLERAERSGALKPGQTVIEATSGNTGIGLAMVCAQKGYPLVIVMAENFSIERRRLMRFLGAKVVLTPAAQKGSGMLAKALELAEAHGWFLTRQFENEANADVHSETTAREILEDFADERLDYWVCTFGTGGTLKGVARALKATAPHTRIVLAEPDNSPMITSGIPQPAASGAVPTSHPMFRPHPVQGTSPDFIPKLAGDAVAARWIDISMPVNGADALRLARELATREGIFAGISSGAAVAAALKIAETAPAGSTILCMLPDTGERYLSTPLFEGVSAEMNAEEEAIAASTHGALVAPRSAAALPTPAAAPADPDAEAQAFVTEALSERDPQVVMFALEWCEFCWAARRLFQAMGVPYRSVDLDSVAYQANDWGGRIRRALQARTGLATIPQIFIGGQLVGGATDVIAAAETGDLLARLRGTPSASGLRSVADPRSFLPGWLQTKRTNVEHVRADHTSRTLDSDR